MGMEDRMNEQDGIVFSESTLAQDHNTSSPVRVTTAAPGLRPQYATTLGYATSSLLIQRKK